MDFKVSFVFSIFFFLCFKLSAQTFFEDYQLIGNQIGKKYITQKQLVQCFKGEQEVWDNGTSIKLFLPNKSVEKNDLFYKSIYNKSRYAVEKYWILLSFQGRASHPYYFDSYTEAVDYILKMKGSIAIVPSSMKIEEKFKITVVFEQ